MSWSSFALATWIHRTPNRMGLNCTACRESHTMPPGCIKSNKRGRESFISLASHLIQMPLTRAVPSSSLRGRRRTGMFSLRSPHRPSMCHRCSVFHVHADHDEHRIILLRVALGRRHRSLWRNGERRLLRVNRRA